MQNLTIRLRLIVTMAFMAVLLVGGGIMGMLGVRSSNAIIGEIFSNQLPSVDALANSRIALLRARTTLDRAIIHPEAADFAESVRLSEQMYLKSEDFWKKYTSLPAEGEEKRLTEEVANARSRFLNEAYTPMLAAIKAGNKDEADRINMNVVQPIFLDYSDKMSKLGEYQFTTAEKLLSNAKEAYSQFVWLDIVGVLLGLGAVFVSAYYLLRAISHPLGVILHQFEYIGSGDLTHEIRVDSSDEMGRLLSGLEQMRQSLARTVSVVRQSSESIASSSDEIATGNMDLSSRTEQQAASLEETASSMEELTSTVQQNADNARQANVLAVSASEVASRGGEVVGNVVHTMSSIKESSSKIVDIIGVIDGIAFQTNILALNAAVEAARAGEQGRGFAVVATEVRSLAQRSANAAKEIKELINDSVAKVEAGTKLVDDAGKTMDEIVVSIKSVADIMAEITAASAEQSDGISQVNLAITKMDETTQQNAALVEQAAAAASSMQDQARHLNREVSIFKVDGQQSSFMNAPAPEAPRQTPKVAKASPKPSAFKKPILKSLAASRAASNADEVAASSSSSNKKVSTPAGEDDWEEF